ncbi:hypothetical protein NC653_021276 [Populus alba x Populus x berolinensis]|uniref:Uncharacterized protein n=1 Tax=Populus alba x Populus x berolinensis TaxID=444605 RepID=A0AAD6QEJ7_9ROSI|nr:hypothetical protein NC653_021276 [Populus alba x Populus x berolinensis]
MVGMHVFAYFFSLFSLMFSCPFIYREGLSQSLSKLVKYGVCSMVFMVAVQFVQLGALSLHHGKNVLKNAVILWKVAVQKRACQNSA